MIRILVVVIRECRALIRSPGLWIAVAVYGLVCFPSSLPAGVDFLQAWNSYRFVWPDLTSGTWQLFVLFIVIELVVYHLIGRDSIDGTEEILAFGIPSGFQVSAARFAAHQAIWVAVLAVSSIVRFQDHSLPVKLQWVLAWSTLVAFFSLFGVLATIPRFRRAAALAFCVIVPSVLYLSVFFPAASAQYRPGWSSYDRIDFALATAVELFAPDVTIVWRALGPLVLLRQLLLLTSLAFLILFLLSALPIYERGSIRKRWSASALLAVCLLLAAAGYVRLTQRLFGPFLAYLEEAKQEQIPGVPPVFEGTKADATRILADALIARSGASYEAEIAPAPSRDWVMIETTIRLSVPAPAELWVNLPRYASEITCAADNRRAPCDERYGSLHISETLGAREIRVSYRKSDFVVSPSGALLWSFGQSLPLVYIPTFKEVTRLWGSGLSRLPASAPLVTTLTSPQIVLPEEARLLGTPGYSLWASQEVSRIREVLGLPQFSLTRVRFHWGLKVPPQGMYVWDTVCSPIGQGTRYSCDDPLIRMPDTLDFYEGIAPGFYSTPDFLTGDLVAGLGVFSASSLPRASRARLSQMTQRLPHWLTSATTLRPATRVIEVTTRDGLLSRGFKDPTTLALLACKSLLIQSGPSPAEISTALDESDAWALCSLFLQSELGIPAAEIEDSVYSVLKLLNPVPESSYKQAIAQYNRRLSVMRARLASGQKVR